MFWDVFYNLCMANSVKPNAVCKELDFSTATATHWKKGTVPNGEALVKIADYFQCSVDYLLERTNFPNMLADTYVTGNNGIQAIKGDIHISGNSGNTNIAGSQHQDEEIATEVIAVLNHLPLRERSKLLTIIYDFEEEYLKNCNK